MLQSEVQPINNKWSRDKNGDNMVSGTMKLIHKFALC